MLTRRTAATTFTLSALVTANILPRNIPASQCNTGSLYCCNSFIGENDPSVAILALLGIPLRPEDFLVGLTCAQVTVIGLGSGSCSAQLACCTGTNFNGVIVLGCTPVDISL